jgi:hypothetical protein
MKVESSTGSATHGAGEALAAINARIAAGLIGFRSIGCRLVGLSSERCSAFAKEQIVCL